MRDEIMIITFRSFIRSRWTARAAAPLPAHVGIFGMLVAPTGWE